MTDLDFNFNDFADAKSDNIIVIRCNNIITAKHFTDTLYEFMEIEQRYVGYITWVCEDGQICFSTQKIYPTEKGNKNYYQLYEWLDYDYKEGLPLEVEIGDKS